MSPDASWGEIRWRDPPQSSNAHDSTMATGEVLAAHSLLGRGGCEDHRHTRLMDHSRRIDHSLHAPQPTLHIGGPLWDSRNNRLPSEPRFSSDPMTSSLYGPRNPAVASYSSNIEEARTGSISTIDHAVNTSRRTSGTLPSISGQYRPSPPAHNTSLPPIASVQEPLNYQGRHATAPEPIIKSESPTCRGCAEKKAVIEDIALAVTSLDDLINSHGFGPFKRVSHLPLLGSGHLLIDYRDLKGPKIAH